MSKRPQPTMPSNPLPTWSANGKPFEIPGMGMQKFQIRDSAVFDVDVVRFHNQRARIDEEHADGTGAEIDHYIDLAKKWGSPEDVTGAEAIAVVNQVAKLMGELRDFFAEKFALPSPSTTAESLTPKPGA